MSLKQPILVDEFLHHHNTLENTVNLTKGWHVAKPYEDIGIFSRFYHAYLILVNKANAVQYAEDLYNE